MIAVLSLLSNCNGFPPMVAKPVAVIELWFVQVLVFCVVFFLREEQQVLKHPSPLYEYSHAAPI